MGSQRTISWVGVLAGICVIVGAACALLWAWLVHLPSYVVGEGYFAGLTERGQTEFFAADAWFVIIGLGAGLGVGWVAWAWLRDLGWPVALLATFAGLGTGVVCMGIGQLLGPGSFDARLATAKPGDSVPISLQLHSLPALAAWGLAAVSPALFASSLGPELRGRREPAASEPEVEPTNLGT